MMIEIGDTVAIAVNDDEGEDIEVVNLLDAEGDPCTPDQAVIVRAGPDRNGHWYLLPRALFEGRAMQ